MRTTVSLAIMMLLAILVSSCDKKKRDPLKTACAEISNTVILGNNCQCMQGYKKVHNSGGGTYDFQCQQQPRCYGNARLDNNNICQCNNGETYDSNNISMPCGDNRIGLTMQQLQQACSGVGQWQNNFCMCTNGQQFNALTRQCEPLRWHHTQTMCGTGATYYGHGNRGVCVCQSPQAKFHPSFGGCSTLLGATAIDHMCKNLYGISGGYVGGRCACPAGRVWFRGSCLDLGHDFITQVPNLPPELQCELRGKRMVSGQCEVYGGGYAGYGREKPIVCERNTLEPFADREIVELYGDKVEVTRMQGRRPLGTVRYATDDYFRLRCIKNAYNPGTLINPWVRDVGSYVSGNPPFFGECRCGPGYRSVHKDDLGYTYCVARGAGLPANRCAWVTLCGEGLNVSLGSRHKSISAEFCRPDGSRFGFYVEQ